MVVVDARDDPALRRVFAIGAEEVTVDQYLRFKPRFQYRSDRSPHGDCPITDQNWSLASEYLDWLNTKCDGDQTVSYKRSRQGGLDHDELRRMLQKYRYRFPTGSEWSKVARGEGADSYFNETSMEWFHRYGLFYEQWLPQATEAFYCPGYYLCPLPSGVMGLMSGVREWGHDGDGTHRFVLGSVGNSPQDFAVKFVQFGPTQHRTDIPMSTNGLYGFRVAVTLSAN